MAVKDRPSGKEGKGGVIEPGGKVPNLGGENEEDTETAIETPHARDHRSRDEESGDEPDRDDPPAEDGEPADEPASRDAKKASSGDPKKPASGDAKRPPKDAPAAAKAEPPSGKPDELAPWLVPIYVLSLLLLLVGERVLPSEEGLRYAFSGLGVAAMVVTTIYRLRSVMGGSGERRAVERLLAFLMAGGLLAIAMPPPRPAGASSASRR